MYLYCTVDVTFEDKFSREFFVFQSFKKYERERERYCPRIVERNCGWRGVLR